MNADHAVLPFWCACLRWKNHHLDQASQARVNEVFAGGGVIYTCLHTQHPFGADDGAVAPEQCGPARACYQPHPNLRLPLLA